MKQMEKTITKLKKLYKNDLFFSISLNIIFLLAAVIIFRPFFEENDDTHIAMISEGVYGIRENHLIYINIILGTICRFLISIMPTVRWHSVIQYVFIFIGATAVSYVLSKKQYGRLVSSVFTAGVFYELYVSLQYTKTSAFATSAGYILIFEYLRNTEKKNRKILITGAILLLYSFLLRDSAFILVSPFFALAAMFEIIKNRTLRRYIVTFIPIFAALAGCYAVNHIAYNSDTGWRDFLVHNEARTQATDYRYDLFDYNNNGDALRDAGVSENDAFLLLTYQFGDDRVMNAGMFNEVVTNGPARKIDIELLKAFAKNMYDTFSVISPIIILLITFVLLFAASGRQNMIFPLCILLGLGAGLFYFQYSGRWSHRLVYATLLAVATVLSYELPDPEAEHGQWALGALGVTGVLTAFIVCTSLAGNRFNYNEYMRHDPDFRAQLSLMEQNKDTLYIIDTFTFQDRCKYDVFNSMEEGSLNNVVGAGMWFVNSPVTRTVCNRYGYTNPFEALEDTDSRVILVDNIYPDQKALFLSEHSGKAYSAEYIGTTNGFDNYRMTCAD